MRLANTTRLDFWIYEDFGVLLLRIASILFMKNLTFPDIGIIFPFERQFLLRIYVPLVVNVREHTFTRAFEPLW